MRFVSVSLAMLCIGWGGPCCAQTPIQAIAGFDPHTVFLTYDPQPASTRFFQDETQKETSLTQAGRQAVTQSPEGQTVREVLKHGSKEGVLANTDIDTTRTENAVDFSLKCLDEPCMTALEQESAQFVESASRLAALKDASQQFNGSFIFNGAIGECRQKPADFLNCCTQKGWGKDLHMADCHEHEKQLNKAIEEKRAIAVGHYCKERYSKALGHGCKEKRQTYCVFSSKLARLIQEKGRVLQLKVSMGKNPEKPNCRGLRPDELQKIDFSKIDFYEIYADLKLSDPPIDAHALAKQAGVS